VLPHEYHSLPSAASNRVEALSKTSRLAWRRCSTQESQAPAHPVPIGTAAAGRATHHWHDMPNSRRCDPFRRAHCQPCAPFLPPANSSGEPRGPSGTSTRVRDVPSTVETSSPSHVLRLPTGPRRHLHVALAITFRTRDAAVSSSSMFGRYTIELWQAMEPTPRTNA
jgi:hypothetical protein